MTNAATPTTVATAGEGLHKPRATNAFSFAAGGFLAIGAFGTGLPRVLNSVDLISSDLRDQLIGWGWAALAAGVAFLAVAVWRLSTRSDQTARTSNQIVVDLRSATVVSATSVSDEAAAPVSPVSVAPAGRS